MHSTTRDLWAFRLLISLCSWVSGLLYAAPGPGRFDLSHWDQSRPLKLDGTWLYMPGRFVEPHEFENILDHDHQDVDVLPGNALLHEEAAAPRYGTYILRLARPQNLADMALLHGLYYSSAKSQVFCRQQPRRSLTLNLGQVGASIPSSTPRAASLAIQNLQELASLPACPELVIMLQVSSQHHSRSGVWQPPHLGRRVEFEALRTGQLRSHAFLLAVLLLMSAYGAGLVWRRQEKSALYVSLGALVLGLRLAAQFHAMQTTAGISRWIWHFENLGMHAAVYLVPYFSWKSLRHVLRGSHPIPWMERVLDGAVLSVLLVQLLTPVQFWTDFTGFLPLLGGCLMLLFLYGLSQSRGKSRPQIGLHAFGLGLAAGGLLLEILVSGRMIDDLPLHASAYGYAIWLFLQLQLGPGYGAFPYAKIQAHNPCGSP
ncbi:7TM diverse intracellular signaling domain-containing protein [Oligoflexus tunisiensis]|uniref:7TM diverse intracellular signaling domain-containing protein n=1 Tax=Oligoflexus tunisiensis TaxID=708132 RepID=UPI00159F1AB5|nr:7TM diverse intracellular signaling domain-containing protein [Oligoflexus tunisiensis]